MKRLVRISVSLSLSLLLLIGGSGVVIGKMICLHSGYTLYTLSEATECCKSCEKNSIKSKCCDLTSISIQTGKYIPQQQLNFKTNSFYTPLYQFEQCTIECSVFSGSKLTRYADLPPPDRMSCTSTISVLRI